MAEPSRNREVAESVFAALRGSTGSRRSASGRRAALGWTAAVVGAVAVASTVTGPVSTATAAPGTAETRADRAAPPSRAAAPAGGSTVTASISPPATHAVQEGETVSSIAGRYGVSTAGLLALNGLGWRSLIFPGQTLRIAPDAPAVASAVPAAPATEHRIAAGDTVSAVAARHGRAVADILAANGLTATSIIYPGQVLRIPSPPPPPNQQDGSSVTPLDAEMAENARVIVAVGRELGVPDRGIVIALASAMQESSLRNLDSGHLDSVGLFQQRPSTGWGHRSALLDPAHAARLFFGGPSNPNSGATRGLLDIPGWAALPLTDAAQAVQLSAHPGAYARWELSATAWVGTVG